MEAHHPTRKLAWNLPCSLPAPRTFLPRLRCLRYLVNCARDPQVPLPPPSPSPGVGGTSSLAFRVLWEARISREGEFVSPFLSLPSSHETSKHDPYDHAGTTHELFFSCWSRTRLLILVLKEQSLVIFCSQPLLQPLDTLITPFRGDWVPWVSSEGSHDL